MTGEGNQAKPISLFYSYSHKDESLRRRLETHLASSRRGGLICEWHDRKVGPGEPWDDQIGGHLTSADIVLLLVSADFIASDYCWGKEVTEALERHRRGEARVIPVILKPCQWQSTPLAKLQAVPRNGKPITSWSDKEKAFDDVVTEIVRAVQTAREKAATPPPATRVTAASSPEPQHAQEPSKPATSPRTPGTVFRDIDEPWCPEMVVIPPGEFMMGSTEAERQWAVEQGAGREWVDAEKPQHLVRIAYPLAVGRFPVTFEEYGHFARTAGRAQPDDRGWGRGPRPVINVSWEDAKAYVEWIAAETGQPYRLLSEAEWEYVCRARTTTRYWWGDEITAENANYGRKVGKTSEVGSYSANDFGLYDTHGNVWELGRRLPARFLRRRAGRRLGLDCRRRFP
jgi:formylglycine-generating enzyme required for sulfatase activity